MVARAVLGSVTAFSWSQERIRSVAHVSRIRQDRYRCVLARKSDSGTLQGDSTSFRSIRDEKYRSRTRAVDQLKGGCIPKVRNRSFRGRFIGVGVSDDTRVVRREVLGVYGVLNAGVV